MPLLGLSALLEAVFLCVGREKENMKIAKKVLDKLTARLYNNHALFEMPV